jgi:hypothetical protein
MYFFIGRLSDFGNILMRQQYRFGNNFSESMRHRRLTNY